MKTLLLILATLLSQLLYAQNLLDSAHSYQYARYAYSIADYAEASIQYEDLCRNSEVSDSTKFYLLTSLYKQKAYKRVLWWCNQWDMLHLPAYLRYQQYRSLLAAQEFAQFDSIIALDTQLLATQRYRLQIFSALLSDNKKKAQQVLQQCQAQQIETDAFLSTLSFRHPWRYALLSAMVPGLGKMLNDRTADGAIACSIVALNAFVSYRAFDKQGMSSVNGWLFAALAAGFYIGNIYGTIVLVQSTPHYIHEKIKHELDCDTFK